MKKLYIITLAIITTITLAFLLFYSDENNKNKRFLKKFDIESADQPYLVEEILIPTQFDEYYDSYNLLQIQSGLSLSQYKGKKAIRYTYKILNFPDKSCGTVYANVITVNSKPVAGDINCPSLSGFILPLSFLQLYEYP